MGELNGVGKSPEVVLNGNETGFAVTRPDDVASSLPPHASVTPLADVTWRDRPLAVVLTTAGGSDT